MILNDDYCVNITEFKHKVYDVYMDVEIKRRLLLIAPSRVLLAEYDEIVYFVFH